MVRILLKIATVLIIFLTVLFSIKTIFSITTGFEEWMNTAVSLSFAALVSGYLWQWLFGEKIGMAAAVVSGILILGSFGFVFGFFGLMFVMRDVQQATAIGILIASPLGMLLGGVSGYILASRQNS